MAQEAQKSHEASIVAHLFEIAHMARFTIRCEAYIGWCLEAPSWISRTLAAWSVAVVGEAITR